MENYYAKLDLVCRSHLQCTELIFKWREGDVVLVVYKIKADVFYLHISSFYFALSMCWRLA